MSLVSIGWAHYYCNQIYFKSLDVYFCMLRYCLVVIFLPTTKGVDPGLRSFIASAMVTLAGTAKMSSRDGAVTMMTGVRKEELDESVSELGCDEGGFSETKRNKNDGLWMINGYKYIMDIWENIE